MSRHFTLGFTISLILIAILFSVGVRATLSYLNEAPWIAAERQVKALTRGPNILVHGVRIRTAIPETAVIYSACAFDLHSGPILLRGPSGSPVWSISVYDRRGVNFLGILAGSPLARSGLVLRAPSSDTRPPSSVPAYRSAAEQGLVLFRLHGGSARAAASVREAQREMRCAAIR